MLDSLPIGLSLYQYRELKSIYMNSKFSEIYGWDADELVLLEDHFKKCFPDKEYREKIFNTMMEDTKAGKPGSLHWEDIRITRKNGSSAIVNIVNIPLSEQNIMVSTVMDVTEQKEAESQLKESEEQFRKLFENHAAVHLLLDPDTGKISNANQAAADYYGYPLEVLKQMNMSEINTMPAEKIQENMRITRRNRRGSFRSSGTNWPMAASGDVAVMVNLMELKKKDYLYCIVYDITERKELFGEIIRAKEKAEESDRLKSAFLANMSHEIRTPLNGILGFTGLLTEKKILSDEKRDSYSKIIHRSAESLMQIIDDILDLSRLDTHQLSLVEKTFNLGESLSGIYLLYLKNLKKIVKLNNP
ncbi:MAG: PAS domain S-box protein [Bacteroidales bacterium]|nr:PAS domain S-box protein [Bacteroidales bacterium]